MPHRSDIPDRLQRDHPLMKILRQVWRRMNIEDEHWMHCIVGREGSGKSHTALRLAQMVDEGFTADRVIFRPPRLLRMLRDEEYVAGGLYVFDEAGVGLGSRTWHDPGQVKLNQALQLVRSHNIGVIFTLPRLGELDTQAEGRLHSYFEIGSKQADEYVRGRWRWLDPDRVNITDEIYRSKPTYKGRDVDTVAIRPPEDSDLVEAYERQKSEFQTEFYDEALSEAETDEDDNNPGHRSPQEVVTDIREDGGVEQYIHEINNGAQVVLDKDLIAADHGIGDGTAKKVKKLLMEDLDRGDLI